MRTNANPNQQEYRLCRITREGMSNLSDVQLIELILQSVQELPWPKGLEHFRGEDGRPVNARMLVSLLAYCYAKGVFDMYEIESRFISDPAVAYLSANQFPGWNTLRNFRRRHKRLIVECLALLFWRGDAPQVQAVHAQSDSSLPAQFSPSGLPRRWDEMSDSIRKSAALVNRAIQVDSMAMDV